MKKILIVGGVAGGATAAARLRRLNEEDQIILFEKDEYISFANCGLPYYIGNVIKQRENLLVQTVEEMANRFNIDVRNFSEVTAIDIKTKMVTVVKVKTNESYTESYDVLILSPGAKAIKPPIEGITEANNLFTLRNLPDTDQIHDYINDQRPATAVVVGGGFIGLEVAENLTERGIKVTIVEKMPQVMAPFDFEMAQLVHQQLNLHGIDLILNDGVKSFANNGRNVNLDSGKVLNTDMIILAIGVAPESSLAKAAGLSLGPKGHIVTTDQMRTIDAKTNEVVNDVYAIGDAVQIKDFVSKTDTAVALAWGANRQGRIVADVVNGIDNRFNGSMGTSALKLFNMVIASVGNNQ
ncbi:MAG: FAD-dependent oxidoreductase, partial [Erysipelotrichaceae bacterium]|nr:FAD-dependent oxidoreductase [Erysipelotrichaceae bacterium]